MDDMMAFKPMTYKGFTMHPFKDLSFCDFGVEFPDGVFDCVTGASTKKEAIDWAKEICDNRIANDRLCMAEH